MNSDGAAVRARAYRSLMRALGRPLHAELCASHGFDRRLRSAHLDMRCALSAEEVEQQFAWRSGDAGSGFPSPCSNGLSGPRPRKLESCAVQSPREEPGRPTDAAPKGLAHFLLVGSGAATVALRTSSWWTKNSLRLGSRRTHPMRKKPGGGPDRIVALSQVKSLSPSALLRRSAKRPHPPGRTSPGPAMESRSRRTQVRGKIAGRPRLK